MYKIAVLPGDGTGPEVVREGLKVLDAVAEKTNFKYEKVMYDLVDHGTHLEGLEPDNIKAHKKMHYKYCALPPQLRSPMVIIMFGNKVAQVLWAKQSFAFVLESESIKESFMKYFNYFWKE